MKKLWCLLVVFFLLLLHVGAQPAGCVLKSPSITIHFGSGTVRDLNTVEPENYSRVGSSCPSDGHYSFTSFSSDCFRGDWHTLEDHTPGDADGNMLLVNASYDGGVFFTTTLTGLKSSTIYEFGVWLTNVCRISDKCPFPLLPNIAIRLQTPNGRSVAQFATGEITRKEAPHWTQYRARFTTPPGTTALLVTMQDMNPGGCGNDFALDDITLRECVPQTAAVATTPKRAAPSPKPTATTTKPVVKKVAAPPLVQKQKQVTAVVKPTPDTAATQKPVLVRKQLTLPPPPALLRNRANPVVKQIATTAGEIKIDLYDNGEIDGDTVTIYHNNVLLVSQARLSQKPITLHIAVDAAQPHHELVMVANNLGSIPPNTSLMIVTAGNKRYEVFISSTEQKNAKVVIDLNE